MTEALAALIPEGKKPWERIEGETDRGFMAFQYFRDQGGLRTIPATARYMAAIEATESHKKRQRILSLTQGQTLPDLTPEEVEPLVQGHVASQNHAIHRWKTKHHWAERVRLYDDHMDGQRVQATEDELKKMVERHLSIAGMLQNKAIRRLQQLDDSALTPKNVLDYITEAVKLERLTRDSPDKRNLNDVPEEADRKVSGAKEMLRGRLTQITKQKAKSEENLAKLLGDDAGDGDEPS